jgi:hypothetical protein
MRIAAQPFAEDIDQNGVKGCVARGSACEDICEVTGGYPGVLGVVEYPADQLGIVHG